MRKLNVGCGNVRFEGWINIDLDSNAADLQHDMREPLPYEESSVDLIYNEHFIEHLPRQEAILALKDFARVLKKGGILRIATPDLDYLVEKYSRDWKDQDWIEPFGYNWLETNAEMMNLSFRGWGHQFIYNQEELTRCLDEAGFSEIRRMQWNQSDHPELSNRETRKDSRLILEAVAPAVKEGKEHTLDEVARSYYAEELQRSRLGERLSEREKALAERNLAYHELEQTLAEKQAACCELKANLEQLALHIDRLEEDLAQKELQLAQLEKDLGERDESLKAIASSRTWHIIARLRPNLAAHLAPMKQR